jgi:hypothetical protein
MDHRVHGFALGEVGADADGAPGFPDVRVVLTAEYPREEKAVALAEDGDLHWG